MILTRRRFTRLAGMTSAAMALGRGDGGLRAQMRMPAGQPMPPPAPPIPANAAPADFTLDIAPYVLEASPKHRYPTVAYNGQVPGPLLRMKQGREVTVDIHNRSADTEIVHWHGLFLPVATDGAMEEGSPAIAPGGSTRIAFTPDPAGFRWFHTHTFAGNDMRKGQYTGQHGFLMIERDSEAAIASPARYDREVAYQMPPYTTTNDFLADLAAETGPRWSPLIDDLFHKITLFDNRVVEASAHRRADGRYDVTLKVHAAKVYADGVGKESKARIADPIDIGVFARAADGKEANERPLLLEKRMLPDGDSTLKLTVAGEPYEAGIDPYNKLIDRVSDDNRMRVSIQR